MGGSRGQFSPFLPGPIDLVNAQHGPNAEATRHKRLGVVLFFGAFAAFLLFERIPALLPLAPLSALALVAHVGAPPRARDSLGGLLLLLALAVAAGLSAVASRAAESARFGYFFMLSLTVLLEEPFKRRRWLRSTRATVARAIAGVCAASSLGALIVAGPRSPHALWTVAAVAGLVAGAAEIVWYGRRMRSLGQPTTWFQANHVEEGHLDLGNGSHVAVDAALPIGPVVGVPRSHSLTTAYRDRGGPTEFLLAAGTIDELTIALWDVETCRWSMAAGIVAATGAPLIAMAIAG
jgi:hypothetical protein